MAEDNTTTPHGVKRIRYRLNANWRGEDTAQIQGTTLSRTEWKVFKGRLHTLQRMIRTVKNPAGMVDMEEFYTSGAADDAQVVTSTVPRTEADFPSQIYSIQHLSSMKHTELMDIARQYGLTSSNKKDKVLVREIMAAQDKRQAPEAPQAPTEPEGEPVDQ